MNAKTYHIEWEGPYTCENLGDLRNTTQDFGIYQIVGSHAQYGSAILLYVGKATQHVFGEQIILDGWRVKERREGSNLQIYVGRLPGLCRSAQPEAWAAQVALIEAEMIHVHAPMFNQVDVERIQAFKPIEGVHVYNWG